VHRLQREELRKKDRHRPSTKFRLGVRKWVQELFKRPSYNGNVLPPSPFAHAHYLQNHLPNRNLLTCIYEMFCSYLGPSGPSIFVVFLDSSRHAEYYRKIDHDRFLLNPSKFTTPPFHSTLNNRYSWHNAVYVLLVHPIPLWISITVLYRALYYMLYGEINFCPSQSKVTPNFHESGTNIFIVY
jgi:hypothetical protein